jgi:hypothetical protein
VICSFGKAEYFFKGAGHPENRRLADLPVGQRVAALSMV